MFLSDGFNGIYVLSRYIMCGNSTVTTGSLSNFVVVLLIKAQSVGNLISIHI